MQAAGAREIRDLEDRPGVILVGQRRATSR
jgi:hypothetical protein